MSFHRFVATSDTTIRPYQQCRALRRLSLPHLPWQSQNRSCQTRKQRPRCLGMAWAAESRLTSGYSHLTSQRLLCFPESARRVCRVGRKRGNVMVGAIIMDRVALARTRQHTPRQRKSSCLFTVCGIGHTPICGACASSARFYMHESPACIWPEGARNARHRSTEIGNASRRQRSPTHENSLDGMATVHQASSPHQSTSAESHLQYAAEQGPASGAARHACEEGESWPAELPSLSLVHFLSVCKCQKKAAP